MATVGNSNHNAKRRLSDTAKPNVPDPIDEILSPHRRGGRRALKLFLIGSVLLAVAVVCAPTIIAHTALRDRLLNMAAGLDGDIDTARGSFGWFSPIALEDVAIFDRNDTTVVQADSITSNSTLLGLLMGPSKPGTFTVQHPVVYLELREKGSNLEDVLKPILQSKKKSSTERVGIKIIDGVVNIHDTVSKRKFQLQQVEVDLAMDKKAERPIEVIASAAMPTDGERAELKVEIRGGDADGGMDKGSLNCRLAKFPLEVVEPFVRRDLPGAKLTGLAEVTAEGGWDGGKNQQTMSLTGTGKIRNFALSADALGRDKLRLEKIDLPCSITRRGDELDVKQLALKTDVGQIAAVGKFLLKEFNPSALMAALQSDAYRLEGEINLAALAAQLPDTLRIRHGTEVTDGKITAVFVGEPERSGIAWSGRVEAANIRAKSNGHRIDWREPVVVDFKAHQTKGGPVVDEANCSSSFLTLRGSGTLDDLKANGEFDLAKLMGELSQFVDMGNLELAGAGEAQLTWQRMDAPRSAGVNSQGFTTHADFKTNNFALAIPGRRAWRERSLLARIDADGEITQSKAGWRLSAIEKSVVTFEAGNEKFTAKLLQPIDKLENPSIPLQVEWQGPLEVWLPRIDPFMSTVGWELNGSGVLKATLVYSAEGTEVRKADFAAEPLRWTGEGWFIDERRVDTNAMARWDAIARTLDVKSATLEADTVLVKLTQAMFKLPTAGTPTMMGSVKFDGDLAQINRWKQDPRQPTRDMAGKLAGQAVISRDGRNISTKLTTTIDDFQVSERRPRVRPRDEVPGWRERQLVITANATYRDAEDTLEIASAEVSSSALQATLRGNIVSPTMERRLDLAGTLNYDWQTLAPFWRPYVGDHVNIVGRESRKFTIRGPVPQTSTTIAGALKPLIAEAGIGWDKADALGLPIGRGEIVAQLNKGQVEVQPIDVAVSDGRLTVAPHIRIAPEPGEIRLDKGPLLTQVRFTPEITANLLKYMAPVLADTAKIDGQFSIDLDGGRIPLDNLKSGDVGGRLIIHSVEVLPGPLAEQYLALGKQIEDLIAGRMPAFGQPSNTKTLLTVQDQTVEVRMVNGRVYHRGMTVTAGKLPIRTTGSVGLDESLELLAEIAVPNDGIGKGAVVNALKGQTLKVPISGTLSKPKLDDRGLQQLAGSIIGNAAKGVLVDEVGKQLDRFLPKK